LYTFDTSIALMPSTSTTKAHLALITANLLFGINFSVVKVIAPNLILPLGLNFMRVLVATSLFWLLFLFHRKNGGIAKKDIPRFILCAITGIAINQILFIKGLILTTPIHASLLILGTPVFILLLSFITQNEKISFLKIVGLLTALAGGIVLVMSKESSALGSNMLLGDIFVLVNAISFDVYLFLLIALTICYYDLKF
jgi:drug/metabolite transporter (DMT)-like permease